MNYPHITVVRLQARYKEEIVVDTYKRIYNPTCGFVSVVRCLWKKLRRQPGQSGWVVLYRYS